MESSVSWRTQFGQRRSDEQHHNAGPLLSAGLDQTTCTPHTRLEMASSRLQKVKYQGLTCTCTYCSCRLKMRQHECGSVRIEQERSFNSSMRHIVPSTNGCPTSSETSLVKVSDTGNTEWQPSGTISGHCLKRKGVLAT